MHYIHYISMHERAVELLIFFKKFEFYLVTQSFKRVDCMVLRLILAKKRLLGVCLFLIQ